MSVTVDPIIDKRLLVTGAAGFIHVSLVGVPRILGATGGER